MKNGEAIWEDPKNEGWFTTDDRGEIRKEFVLPLGSGSDFIKVLGEGVNLLGLQTRLESLVAQTAFTQDLVIVAIPDPRMENRICLVASQNAPTELVEGIILKFNQQVSSVEKIQESKVVDQIPRTALGKLSREELIRRISRL